MEQCVGYFYDGAAACKPEQHVAYRSDF